MAFKRSGSRKLVYKKTLSKHTASKKKRVGKIRKSAFRAVSGIDQEITDGVFSKVQYQVEELILRMNTIHQHRPSLLSKEVSTPVGQRFFYNDHAYACSNGFGDSG